MGAKLDVSFITVSIRKTTTVALTVKCQDSLNVPIILSSCQPSSSPAHQQQLLRWQLIIIEYSVEMKAEIRCKKPAAIVTLMGILDNEVNELMYDMMMKVNWITFTVASSTIVLIFYFIFSDKMSSISNNMFSEAQFRKYAWEQNC